ncbi:serine/threonine-protein kinase [Nocardioides massiliensis]|uniref:non-specific serine/threonine protein kinase n=1 Tax=Nocardioides massiliensis TaxID=1325935 RepID=A0ABT9NQ02_9ACTN|nr:serine/threonine-protein kinase [Nocardioides massiliensis]MDP9822501.1 serine/threonine protein kinase [Nocardioides massiliensis]
MSSQHRAHLQDTWGFTEGDPITEDLTAMRLLGGGENFEAYLAFDDVTYGAVVVKMVRPGLVDSASVLRGLRREVASLDLVNHPVVVRGLRAVTEGERPHVVLEHLEGPRLSTLIRKYGPLQQHQYLPLAIEIASALHYFRRVGLVHLDIKPSNIIMGAPARLIDLSVARTPEQAAQLTYPIGTDLYMAPEQTDPPTTGTPGYASDVFGLGASLFEAIAGYRPFDDGDRDGADLAARFPQTRDLSYTLPEDKVAPDVAAAVYAALDPDPAKRPAPAELAEALEPALARVPRGRLAGFKVRA